MAVLELLKECRLVGGSLGTQLRRTVSRVLDAREQLIFGLLQVGDTVLHEAQRVLNGHASLRAAKEIESVTCLA